MNREQRAEMNLTALERISDYLIRHPRFITAQEVAQIEPLVGEEEAVLMLLCAACGIDAQEGGAARELAQRYFRPSLKKLDPAALADNPYLRCIRFPQEKLGHWALTHLSYAPYEIFVRDDLLILPDGREIPQLGYFDREVVYPAVLQNGREWMTVTPNEIATMEKPIAAAHGHVAVLGLGLGYYAFMVSEKENVSRVTVIERDLQAIALFRRHILPQFPHAGKVQIVQADAFEYVKSGLGDLRADFAFVDLWHDVSDGAPMYLKMKALESCAPDTQFAYWIETSIAAFLRSL